MAQKFLNGVHITGNITVEDSEIYVGDISGDSWTRILHAQADGYGFDWQHDNATVLVNEQGSTNQALVLGDVDAGDNDGLFGIAHKTASTSWAKVLNLKGNGELYIGSSGTSQVYHEGHLPTLTELGAASSSVVNQSDFVSAASGGTFSGNVNVFPNASTGTFRVGRYAGQEFKLHSTDLINTLTSINDADNNQNHDFILDRVHAGTGADNFKIQKNGSNQLTIDKDGLADFVGHIKADNVGSGTTIVRPGTDAQWSASGNTTGRIEITLPGTTASGNHGMVYLQIDVYEYQSGIGPSTYFVGGHNWNNGWHNYNAHKIGNGSKKIYLGVRNSRYVVLIGDANSSWSYGSVHVSYASNGAFYSSNMDMVDGVTTNGSGQWSATQVTHADSDYTNLASDLAATVDFKGSDLKADSFVVDGGASTSFLKADGSLDSTTYTTGTIPTDFVSAVNGGTFGGDVHISPGSSSVATLGLRRDTTSDSTIVGDINFLTSAAEGTDDRIGLIRTQTSGGDTTTRGGSMFIYTRKSGSADFNTTTYNKDGAWSFPSSISATTLNTGQGANELYAMDQAVRTTDNVEFADLTVANLTVTGTNTILNTTTVEVEDNIILLNKTASDGSATASTSGIAINRGGTTADASFIFGESDDYWDLTHNFQVAGDAIVSGGDLTVTKQNGSPVIRMLRDGTNPGVNTLLQHLQFTVDYDTAHQEWGGIEHRTTTSAARTKLNFNVKSTSGNVLNALSLDGTTDGTEAIFGGNARLPSSGRLYTWTGHNLNYLDYRTWQASSSAGMSIINTASAGHLFLKTNSLTGLEIDELGGTTVTGHTIPVGGTVLDVQGTQGQLFSVTNDLTGDLFEVSDISGSPILTVNSSGAVTVDGDITATSTTVSGAASVGGNLDVAEYIRHIGDLNTFLQFPGTNDKLVFTTNGSTVLTIDASNKSTFTGAMVVGPGTTGAPYDSNTFLHVKGTTRSIVQQSSTADAYYMFGDAAANNAAWVGYNHSSGTLDLHAETAITLDKNTTISGNISATNLSGTNTGDQDLSGYATTGSIPTDFVSAANGGTFGGGVTTPDLTVNGTLKWATTGSSYTYSNDDSSGMYIERVGTTNALSDIRIQGRPPVSTPQSPAYQYTSLHIKPSNHTIVLNTSGTTALSVNSAQKTTMHGGFEGLANSYITTSGTTLLTLTGDGNGYVNAGIVLNSTDDDGHSRGGGIYMNNEVGETEWFMGRPYSSADQFQINRRATTAGTHHDATAEGGGTTISGHGTTETLLNIDSSGNMTVTGNLTVEGSTTTLNTQTLDVEDLNITVGKDTTNSSTSDGAGITFGGYSGAPQFYWHHTNDTLYANESIQATRFYGPVTGNVTGNASGSSGSCTGNAASANYASDYSNYMYRKDNRVIAPTEDSNSRMRFGFTSWGNNNSSPYADYLHMRSYSDSSGGSDNLVMFKKGGIGMRIWQQSFNSSTAYSSYHNVYSLPYEYNQSNTDVDTGATRDIAAVSDTVGNAVFFDFVIKKGSNVRAGTVYTCHNGTDVEFTETSTADIGDTSDVTLSVVRHSNQIKLQAVTTTNDWSIKTLIRHI